MSLFKNIIFLYIVTPLALVLTVLPSASCSNTGPAGSSGVFEQILSAIPDTENNSTNVYITDYAQMRTQFQINAPAADAAAKEQFDYVTNLFKMSGNSSVQVSNEIGFINPSQYLQNSLETMRIFGIGYWLIDQEATTGVPPTNFSLLKGRFDPEKVRQTITANSPNDPPFTEKYENNTIFGWGGDLQMDLKKALKPPAYDFLGRGGRFVFQDDFAFRTNGTEGIKSIIDAQNDKITSLMDVSEYKLMAGELSSRGTMMALLSNQTQNAAFVRKALTSYKYEPKEADQYLAQGPRLLPYQTVAIGVAKDESGLHLLIIMVHADDRTAAANVPLLRQRIEETTQISGQKWNAGITGSSITSDGRVLVAKLYGRVYLRSFTWYPQGDCLLLCD